MLKTAYRKLTAQIGLITTFYIAHGTMAILGMYAGGLAFLLPAAAVLYIIKLDADVFNPWFTMWCGACGGVWIGNVDGKMFAKKNTDEE